MALDHPRPDLAQCSKSVDASCARFTVRQRTWRCRERPDAVRRWSVLHHSAPQTVPARIDPGGVPRLPPLHRAHKALRRRSGTCGRFPLPATGLRTASNRPLRRHPFDVRTPPKLALSLIVARTRSGQRFSTREFFRGEGAFLARCKLIPFSVSHHPRCRLCRSGALATLNGPSSSRSPESWRTEVLPLRRGSTPKQLRFKPLTKASPMPRLSDQATGVRLGTGVRQVATRQRSEAGRAIRSLARPLGLAVGNGAAEASCCWSTARPDRIGLGRSPTQAPAATAALHWIASRIRFMPANQQAPRYCACGRWTHPLGRPAPRAVAPQPPPVSV